MLAMIPLPLWLLTGSLLLAGLPFEEPDRAGPDHLPALRRHRPERAGTLHRREHRNHGPAGLSGE